MSNELTQIIQTENIAPTQAEFLLENFKTIFETAKHYELKTREIIVNDVSQISEMQKARTIRLELKNLRIEANKKRVELKEESLRTGKAIQGIYNVIEALIIPMEKYLEDQEKFKERIEEKEKEEKFIKRSNLLSKFVNDIYLYNLKEMSEEGFNELLQASEIAYNKRIEEEKKIEQDRLKKEEEDWKENTRIRLENEKLRKEAKEREEKRIKAEKENEKKLAKIREENEKKLSEQKKKLEEEAKKRKEAEDKIAEEKKLAEEKILKEEEYKRKLELAPDKEKLIKLSNEYANFNMPEVNSEEAKSILKQVKDLSNKIAIYIVKNANNL